MRLKNHTDYDVAEEASAPLGSVPYHTPVLLNESVDGLHVHPDGIYVDVTFGGGGHSREILRRLTGSGHLYSFDQDLDAIKNVDESFAPGHFTFIRGNFRYLRNYLRYEGVEQVDGVLADLGVSSHHFDDSSRGFSFRFDGALDMRMNQQARRTAADIVNDSDEERLADIFYLYGELKQSRQIAAALVKARQEKRIETVGDFLQVVEPLLGRRSRGDKGDAAKKELAKAFQALRIEVNGELTALHEMLRQATELLRPGGRLSVITYHSLEDRMVKNLMKTGNCEGRENKDFFGRVNSPFRPVNSKVIRPDADEQVRNPRSRSAKLRVAEKTGD